MWAALADWVLAVHALFVLFVIGGGLLSLRWPKLMWVHVPAILWGAAVEFGGWLCPLTPIENRLRAAAGQAGYRGDFIAHYLGLTLYPPSLTRSLQIYLAVAVLLLNALVYSLLWRRRQRALATRSAQAPTGTATSTPTSRPRFSR